MGNLTHTVSGDIASFRSAARVPIESLKCHFLPVQEGSGDPSPENVRPISGWNNIKTYCHGKNLIKLTEYTGQFFNVANETDLKNITERITVVENNNVISLSVSDYPWYGCVCATEMLQPGNYTIHTELSDSNVRRSVYITDANFITVSRSSYVNDNLTITLVERGRIIVTLSLQGAGTTGTITNLQVEIGNNYTSYEPYRGEIIPITFPNVNKNKLPIGTVSFTQYKKYVLDKPLPPGAYTISATVTSSDTDSDNQSLILFEYAGESEKSHIFKYLSRNTRNSQTLTIYRPCSTIYIYASTGYVESAGDTATWTDVQLEVGTSMTEYEPYEFNNTVYGGYIDIAKGELVQTHFLFSRAIADMNNSENYPGWKNCLEFTQVKNYIIDTASGYVTNLIGNIGVKLRYNSRSSNGTTPTVWLGKPDYGEEMTMSKWKEDYPNLIVQFIVPLSTPIIYPLAAQELKTFLNYNNIWSNTNDITEVSYQIHDSNMIQNIRKSMMGYYNIQEANSKCQ